MPTIRDTYINALLADAAYVDDLADGLKGDALRIVLSPRMTPDLATFIAANFEVAAHKESNDTFGSGFDATAWRGKAGTAYAGKVYVSMRGTTGPGDFLADLDLSTSGGATAQFVDMVNWWFQITTPAGQAARQIILSPTPRKYFQEAAAGVGTGLLLGVSRVEVNGHSLGGHLASAFARVFGGSSGIDRVSTFNSAGFTPLSALVFNDLEAVLRTGAGRYLGVMLGASQQVRVEADANPLSNHSVVTLEDALDALRTVFIGSASNEAVLACAA